MNFKESLLECIRTEIETCKHLYSKIPSDAFEVRPAQEMRSIEELLQYLMWSARTPVTYFRDAEKGRTLREVATEHKELVKRYHVTEFEKAMDDQYADVAAIISAFTDHEIETKMVKFPWQTESTLGHAIMETAVKWLAAYKMQLFVYLKMQGIQLNTADCWATPFTGVPAQK
jgi:hypothetical protein